MRGYTDPYGATKKKQIWRSQFFRSMAFKHFWLCTPSVKHFWACPQTFVLYIYLLIYKVYAMVRKHIWFPKWGPLSTFNMLLAGKYPLNIIKFREIMPNVKLIFNTENKQERKRKTSYCLHTLENIFKHLAN